MAELNIAALYAEHGEFVARVLEQLTGEGAHVDDLLQECFVAAFRSRDNYDESRGSITTWLYSIAANMSKRHRRGTWRFGRLQQRVSVHEVSPPVESPEEELLRAQGAAVVHETMQKLPFKQREVFALYELEGLDGGTIAEMLGIPEGTVWTRLHHARRGFAKMVQARMAKEGVS